MLSKHHCDHKNTLKFNSIVRSIPFHTLSVLVTPLCVVMCQIRNFGLKYPEAINIVQMIKRKNVKPQNEFTEMYTTA